jgi:hypothetical protein
MICAKKYLVSLTFLAVFPHVSQAQDVDKTRAEIATLESMLPKVPDRAVVFYLLAEDYAQTGDQKKALALLKESMAVGEGLNPGEDAAFRALHSNAEFRSLVSQAEQQYPPVHHAREAFTVPEKDLIPEGLAYDADRNVFYLSSLFHRKIVQIDANGHSTDFAPTAKENLLPICGVHLDEDYSLWAAGCQNSGHGELYHFSPYGKLLERFPPSTPGAHLFNDFVLNSAADIYLTDSLANQVYLFNRQTHTFASLTFPRPLFYPNGITQSNDHNALYVADAFGVLRYDLKTHQAMEVDPGSPNTLAGFDGLYWYSNGLVGVQNGIGLPRIAQAVLSSDGLHVTKLKMLEYRSRFVSLPTTGSFKGSKFYFIENSQIDNMKDDRIADPSKLEPVRIGVIDLAQP